MTPSDDPLSARDSRLTEARITAAAHAGDADAQAALAERLAGCGDGATAVHWLRRAADAGHSGAAALLGAWQILGQHVTADPAAGLARLGAAAAAGDDGACAFLANVYAGGLCVTQDWNTAMDWLLAAARRGNARALTQLSLLAAGGAPDPLRVNLLFAAATRDFAPAQFALGRELVTSDDPRHREVGSAWIGTAARAGNPCAIADGGTEQPQARWPGPVSLDGVDWSVVRTRCAMDPWLSRPTGSRLRPTPQIETLEELIPVAWCQYVVGLASSRLQRATVNDTAQGQIVHPMRTNSSTSFPATDSDPLLQLINQRLALACRLPLEHQEMTAVLHYRPGQTYRDHFDFIDPDVRRFADELATRGQRVATALVYLSDGYDGGETDFPLLSWRYKGRVGDAIVFRNVTESGTPDRRTLHAGRPPASGEKWLLSKWIRDRPQDARDRG